jgi:hypothetical protein
MDLPRLIVDVQACVSDGEWERAETYLEDLRRAVQLLLREPASPRSAGAIVATLGGVERAMEQHNAAMAGASLRHLVYCCTDLAA